MNAVRSMLPMCSRFQLHPLWLGVHSGLKSYRSESVHEDATTGIPDHFESDVPFNATQLLIKTGCIDDAKKIY